MGDIGFRLMSVLAAYAVGWIVYMCAMVLTCYDGVLSLIFQPIMGAVITAVTVSAAVLVGLVFRLPCIGRLWNWRWAGVLAVGSLAMMLLGSRLGLSSTFTDPDTQDTFVGLNPTASILSYGLLIFCLANWPAPRALATRQP